MLRHTLATLAYRAGKVLRDAPPGFSDFRASETSRSRRARSSRTWATSWTGAPRLPRATRRGRTPPLQAWDADVDRFFAALARFDAALAAAGAGAPAEKLFQGPVADALTHIGQLAMMRRLAGVPIKGENYFIADIAEGRVGLEQAPPRREF